MCSHLSSHCFLFVLPLLLMSAGLSVYPNGTVSVSIGHPQQHAGGEANMPTMFILPLSLCFPG